MSDAARETYPVAFWIAACDAANARADKQAERIRVLEEALRAMTEQYASVMRTSYGRDVTKDGNPYVKAARAALKEQP